MELINHKLIYICYYIKLVKYIIYNKLYYIYINTYD